MILLTSGQTMLVSVIASLAMKAAGLDYDTINKVTGKLFVAFDDYSVDDAEVHYFD